MAVISDPVAELGGRIRHAASAAHAARPPQATPEQDRVTLERLPDDVLAEIIDRLHVRADATTHANLHATASRFREARVTREPYAAARLIARATREDAASGGVSEVALHAAIVSQRRFASSAVRAEVLGAAASRIACVSEAARSATYDALLSETATLQPANLRAPVLAAVVRQQSDLPPAATISGRRYDGALAQILALPTALRADALSALADGMPLIDGESHAGRYAALLAEMNALPSVARAQPLAALAQQLSAVAGADRAHAAHATLAALTAAEPPAARALGLAALAEATSLLPDGARTAFLDATLAQVRRLPPAAQCEAVIAAAREIGHVPNPTERTRLTRSLITQALLVLPRERASSALAACAVTLHELPDAEARHAFHRLFTGIVRSGPAAERPVSLASLTRRIGLLGGQDRTAAFDRAFVTIGSLPPGDRGPALAALAGQILALEAPYVPERLFGTYRAIEELPVDACEPARRFWAASFDRMPAEIRRRTLRLIALRRPA